MEIDYNTLRGKEAASFIMRCLNDLRLNLRVLTAVAINALSTYPRHAFPFAERRARVSRILGITSAHADALLVGVDRFVNPRCFKRVDFDIELIQRYRDGSGSDVPRSVDVVLTCPLGKCFICGAPFDPLSPYNPEIGVEELYKGEAHMSYFYHSQGRYTAYEITRSCSNRECRAIHHTSHARCKDETAGGPLKIVPFTMSSIVALRCSNLSYVHAALLNEAVIIYDEGRVPIDRLAYLLDHRRWDLSEPAERIISPKVLFCAIQIWLAIWWLQNVPRNQHIPELDITDMFGTDTSRLSFLARETRDNSPDDRGILAMAMTHWAILHKCVDHCGCGKGVVQDGQFDLTRKLTSSELKEKIKNDSMKSKLSAKRKKSEKRDQGDGSDKCLLSRSNGEYVQIKGAGLEQQWHPLIRREVRIAAHQIPTIMYTHDSATNVADIVSALNCINSEHEVRGVVTHRDSAFVWSIFLFDCANEEAGMFIQVSTAHLHAYLLHEQTVLPLESIPSCLWGTLDLTSVNARTAPLATVPVTGVSDDLVGDEELSCEGKEDKDDKDDEDDDDDEDDQDDHDDHALLHTVTAATHVTTGPSATSASSSAAASSATAVSSAVIDDPKVKVVMSNFEYAVDCIAKADAQPTVAHRLPRTNHVEVIAGVCRVNYSFREFPHTGEGALSNCQQLIDLVSDYILLGRRFSLVSFCDDACSNLMTLMKEMVSIARGKPTRLQPIAGVITLLCIDAPVDGFHFVRNHKEIFCKMFLDPEKRNFPYGMNSQAVEENWQVLVKHCPSLCYMDEGTFRFMLLSIIQMENMARAKTPVARQSKKRSKSTLDNLGPSKHKRNYEKAHGKKKAIKKTVHGRLPIPEEFSAAMPDGYDPRLREVDGSGNRVYTDFDPTWIITHEAHLVGIIRRFIPQHGFGRPPVSNLIRARQALHSWLVDMCVEERGPRGDPNGESGAGRVE